MDPLSIAASIAGLLAAGAQISKILGPFVSASRAVPQVAFKVYSEVESTRTVLAALKGLLTRIATRPVKHASLITVKQIVIILANGIFIFSELELAAGCLLMSVPSSHILQLRCRLQWARKESTFNALLSRLESFKSSLSLVLDILQYDSDLRAEQHHAELSVNLKNVMESNTELKERLRNLEDVIDSRTFIARHSTAGSTLRSRSEQNLRNRPETNIEMRLTESKHPASSGSLQKSYFDFEPDLKASRVYRRVKRDTMDYSFRSSVASRTWSMFSGLSLSDVSIMSVIALPICSEDLTNPGHYAFGSDHPPPRSMQTQIVFDRERSIFHDCIEVKAQLLHCPGFTALFDETNALQDEATNPMDELRRVFQQGFPLLMLSNFWQGSKDDKDISALQAAGEADKGRLVKLAAHEFLFDLAVLLRMDLRDLFTFDDFVGSSYIGFSKVVTVLAMALAELTRLLLIPTIPTLPRSDLADNEDPISRSKALLDQFVRDERVYLLHLEQLLESRTIIEKYELLHQDELNFIFKPVSVMMDSQIQFLLGIELILSASHENQSRARLFESWCEGPALPTLETFVKREKINRELLTIHLEASQANEKSLRILSTCRSLLSTPRFRLGKYHEFLNVRGHNRTLQRLEAKDDLAWPWESRSEKALLVSNTIQGAQAKMQTVIRIEEEREILRSVRTRVHEWDGLKLRMVDRVLLYDSFKAEDVQGNYTKGYIVCLFPGALLWYEADLCFLEDPAKPDRRVKIASSYNNVPFATKGAVPVERITAVVPKFAKGTATCRVHWFSTKKMSDSGHLDLYFPSKPQMYSWEQRLNTVKTLRK